MQEEVKRELPESPPYVESDAEETPIAAATEDDGNELGEGDSQHSAPDQSQDEFEDAPENDCQEESDAADGEARSETEVEAEPFDDSRLEYMEPYTPKPATDPTAGDKGYSNDKQSFESNGDAQLATFLEEALLRLDETTRSEMMTCPLTSVDIGTLCSGTDAPVLVLKAFRKAASKVLGLNIQLRHRFSCEKNSNKQEFLTTMSTLTHDNVDVECLMSDTKQVSRGLKAKVVDLLTDPIKQDCPLPGCTEVFMGFPCQDVSRLNPLAGRNRRVVAERAQRTGSVFNHAMSYSKAVLSDETWGPKFRGLVLENVTGLLVRPKGKNPETDLPWHNNLEYCALAAQDAGMVLLPFVVGPELFGMPVSRQRVYMMCLPKDLLDRAGVKPNEVLNMAASLLDRLVVAPGLSTRSLEDFFLPKSHLVVQKELQRSAELAADRRAKQMKKATECGPRAAKAPRWAEQHRAAFKKAGLDWWEPSVPDGATLARYPGLGSLTDRQFDLCALLQIKYPDRRVATVDLSQSVSKTASSKLKLNHASIVTPSCHQLVLPQARCLTGYECLHLQGLHWGRDHPRLMDYVDADNLLKDLAGNAFQAHCFGAIYIVKVALHSKLEVMALVRSKQQNQNPCAHKDSIQKGATVDDLFGWIDNP